MLTLGSSSSKQVYAENPTGQGALGQSWAAQQLVLRERRLSPAVTPHGHHLLAHLCLQDLPAQAQPRLRHGALTNQQKAIIVCFC